jgi:hypothetical protein
MSTPDRKLTVEIELKKEQAQKDLHKLDKSLRQTQSSLEGLSRIDAGRQSVQGLKKLNREFTRLKSAKFPTSQAQKFESKLQKSLNRAQALQNKLNETQQSRQLNIYQAQATQLNQTLKNTTKIVPARGRLSPTSMSRRDVGTFAGIGMMAMPSSPLTSIASNALVGMGFGGVAGAALGIGAGILSYGIQQQQQRSDAEMIQRTGGAQFGFSFEQLNSAGQILEHHLGITGIQAKKFSALMGQLADSAGSQDLEKITRNFSILAAANRIRDPKELERFGQQLVSGWDPRQKFFSKGINQEFQNQRQLLGRPLTFEEKQKIRMDAMGNRVEKIGQDPNINPVIRNNTLSGIWKNLFGEHFVEDKFIGKERQRIGQEIVARKEHQDKLLADSFEGETSISFFNASLFDLRKPLQNFGGDIGKFRRQVQGQFKVLQDGLLTLREREDIDQKNLLVQKKSLEEQQKILNLYKATIPKIRKTLDQSVSSFSNILNNRENPFTKLGEQQDKLTNIFDQQMKNFEEKFNLLNETDIKLLGKVRQKFSQAQDLQRQQLRGQNLFSASELFRQEESFRLGKKISSDEINKRILDSLGVPGGNLGQADFSASFLMGDTRFQKTGTPLPNQFNQQFNSITNQRERDRMIMRASQNLDPRFLSESRRLKISEAFGRERQRMLDQEKNSFIELEDIKTNTRQMNDIVNKILVHEEMQAATMDLQLQELRDIKHQNKTNLLNP